MSIFHLRKHSPLFQSAKDEIVVMAEGSAEQCVEALRAHFLHVNQSLVELSRTTEVPECILQLARDSIVRNADLDIHVDLQGIVYVDGIGPEMDYYTITEDKYAMLQVHLEDLGDVLNVDGTFSQLEAECRRVGLVGDTEDVYKSLREFLEANCIQITRVIEPEVLSIEDLVRRWV